MISYVDDEELGYVYLPLGGHRNYSADVAERLRFIKRAQGMGFTPDEVGGLLTLDETCACTETRALAAHKLALIEQKINTRKVRL